MVGAQPIRRRGPANYTPDELDRNRPFGRNDRVNTPVCVENNSPIRKCEYPTVYRGRYSNRPRKRKKKFSRTLFVDYTNFRRTLVGVGLGLTMPGSARRGGFRQTLVGVAL